MKKFFTLIAAVALAASVNAQGTYAVQVGDKVNAGDHGHFRSLRIFLGGKMRIHW